MFTKYHVIEHAGYILLNNRQLRYVNYIPFPQAFKNILEQLSVRLWCYNAKMLHALMQLEELDVCSWDLPTRAGEMLEECWGIRVL